MMLLYPKRMAIAKFVRIYIVERLTVADITSLDQLWKVRIVEVINGAKEEFAWRSDRLWNQ